MVAGGYATGGTVTCADARRLGVTPRWSSALAQAVHKTNQQSARPYVYYYTCIRLNQTSELFTFSRRAGYFSSGPILDKGFPRSTNYAARTRVTCRKLHRAKHKCSLMASSYFHGMIYTCVCIMIIWEQ